MKVVPTKSALERQIESTSSNNDTKNLDWAFRPLLNWINCILGLNVPFLRILIYTINLLIHVSLYSFDYYFETQKNLYYSTDQMNKESLKSNTNYSDYSTENHDETTSTFSWNRTIDYANFTVHSLSIHTILVVGPRFKRRWGALWTSINELEEKSVIKKNLISKRKIVTKFRRISILWLIYIMSSV